MSTRPTITVLCLASYEKGEEFIRECKRQGCRVFLLTVTKLEHANWPREAIDETFYLPDLYKLDDVIHGVSYLARSQVIDRIVPLDDYDVEMAAALREHLRLPGMGDTTTRHFRDKLAMRTRAKDHGILVPEFCHVLNYDRLREFMNRVPGPWVLKPRSEASTVGIKKINQPDELWPLLDALGDEQSFHLLEQYIPGDIFHVDSIVSERNIVFAEVHQYGQPPLDVAHGGGIFTTHTVDRESLDWRDLIEVNRRVLVELGFVRGVTHIEFIKGRDNGEFYFLEAAARVGGANIADLVQAATGVNLWAEWAKIEIAQDDWAYQPPERRYDYAGLIISLARQEYPDTSAYNAPEIEWRLNKRHHVGFVVASSNAGRVEQLLDEYGRRIYDDFYASLPVPDEPTS